MPGVFKQQTRAVQSALDGVGRAAALQAGKVVPAYSSFGAQQSESEAERDQQARYCDGLQLRLAERVQVRTQLDAARIAFAATDRHQLAAARALADEYMADIEGQAV